MLRAEKNNKHTSKERRNAKKETTGWQQRWTQANGFRGQLQRTSSATPNLRTPVTAVVNKGTDGQIENSCHLGKEAGSGVSAGTLLSMDRLRRVEKLAVAQWGINTPPC